MNHTSTASRIVTAVLIGFFFAMFGAGVAFGQTYELKDRQGMTVLTLDNVKMSRYSDYFKEEIPAFQGTVKNVSGETLSSVSIVGTVHKKDGTIVRFVVGALGSLGNFPIRLHS